MKALLVERNLARFAASRVTAAFAGSGKGAGIGPLRLTDVEPPELPLGDWYRVAPILSGICGSDLATVDGKSSRYFEDIVSFPFVPGHEVVGRIAEAPPGGGPQSLSVDSRVVIEPAIGCIPRGIDPPCPACAESRSGGCERVAFGHLSPGLQIGFCADTGGGWSRAGLVAHRVQIHAVPDSLTDEEAVMVEPTACALHGALAAGVEPGSTVAVVGAGTLGLTTIAALRRFTEPGMLVAGAKHPAQKRLASELGADLVVGPSQIGRAVRRKSRSLQTSSGLTGGADVVIDCVGTSDSLTGSLSMVKPRGRIVVVGMPASVTLDLASLWHREVVMAGAYAYGTEVVGAKSVRTFDLAIDLVASAGLGRLVSARYPIDRFEEAIAHAGSAGRRGATKIVFDLERGARKGTPS